MKLQFLIDITEGTSICSEEGNFYREDFSKKGFLVAYDEIDIAYYYHLYCEENFRDYDIVDPTFLLFPVINDEVIDINISEEIDEDGCVYIDDLENWFKSKGGKSWFRNYQLENNLGITLGFDEED
jgi:hypothetical protein